MEQIRRVVSHMPIVALIPTDTRDYRDAAVRQGANAVVAIDRADTDLLPTIKQLLSRIGLVNGVTRRITQAAQASTPIGEAAHRTDAGPLDLKALSERVVEQLSPYAEASIVLAASDRFAATQPQLGCTVWRGRANHRSGPPPSAGSARPAISTAARTIAA